jgi:uncharacterized membrane protein
VKKFSREEKEKITAAIKQAERQTSAEIRLFIEDRCRGNVLDRAAIIFEKLKMHRTVKRNGVLFYLAIKDHNFAILGDAGINALVKSDFWEEIKEIVLDYFKKGEYSEGLSMGMALLGDTLKEYFPYDEPYDGKDKNELPDEIVFGQKDT